jgi:hypothetical protein
LPAQQNATAAALARLLHSDPRQPVIRADALLEPFSAFHMTEQLAEFFREVLNTARPGLCRRSLHTKNAFET